MTDTTIVSQANEIVANRIRSIVEILRERADALEGYAEAIRQDPTLIAQLGDQHAGPSAALQILEQVDQRSKSPDLYPLRHALFTQLARWQRGA